nr:IgGFc-binding protein [Bacteroidales bacterium]
MGRHLRTLLITALWVLTAGLSHAQQGGGPKEYWFSYGRTNKDVEVLFGDTAAYYELHITSRFRTSGIIVFTHNKDTVPFTVTPGTAFVHRLSYSQRGATYHDKTGKFDLSACVLCNHEVSVSTIARLGFSTDAGLILPAHALGTGYRVMMTEPDLGALLLIATQDGTVIRLNGNPLCTLDRGETYYWINSLAASKLQGGEQLEGDKPFVCLFTQILGWIPHNIPSADQLFEQCFPQKLLGTEYYVPVSIMGEDYVQVMVTEAGTNITLSGGRVAVNQFRNGTTRLTGLNAGQWVWIKVNQQDSGCLIRSDKPVILFTYLAAHYNFPNNGGLNVGGYSDPSVAAVPETGRRVASCIFRPYEMPVDSNDRFPPRHYGLVALP